MAKAKKKASDSDQLLQFFQHKNFVIIFFLAIFGLLGGVLYSLI